MGNGFITYRIGDPATAKDWLDRYSAITNKHNILINPTPVPATADPLKRVYQEAGRIYNALQAAGLSPQAASYGTYQSYHETGAWVTNYLLYWQHNNGSGIMYAGQPGAIRGTNGYAWFNTFQDWINSFVHELTKGANPSGATSIEDYVNRLVANRYFTGNPADYLSGMKGARLVLKTLPAEARAGIDYNTGKTQAEEDLDIPGSVNYGLQHAKFDLLDTWNKLPLPGKIGVALVGVLLTAKILK